MANNNYDKDSIQSLDAREHIRLRSGMYVGDTSNPNQLLLEVFSNALDEYCIGHGNKIEVTILPDGECEVVDHAQGFLVGQTRGDGKTILEASFSVVNTSGKYSDDGVYEGSSLGINGLGAKTATFLSSRLEVETHRDGAYELIVFKDGLKFQQMCGEWMDASDPSGTKVRWKPDAQFFTSDKTQVEYFKKFFSDIACLCPQLTIELRTDKDCFVYSERTMDDLISDRLNGAVETISQRFNFNSDRASLVLTFTGKSHCDIVSYVNYGLVETGPHITIIKSTLTRVLNNWARERGLLKQKDKNLDGNSLQEGLLLACNIVSKGVSYDAQTKSKVVKMDTSPLDSFGEELEVWLDTHPEDGEAIVSQAIVSSKAAEAARKAREAVKQKATTKQDKLFKLPTKLTDCWTKDRSKAELLIAEGLSAATGLVAARDSEFQSVYGVRGKMISALKASPDKVVKNQEVNNLIVALGLDYSATTGKMVYDKSKLRYDKIIACADADFDGQILKRGR